MPLYTDNKEKNTISDVFNASKLGDANTIKVIPEIFSWLSASPLTLKIQDILIETREQTPHNGESLKIQFTITCDTNHTTLHFTHICVKYAGHSEHRSTWRTNISGISEHKLVNTSIKDVIDWISCRKLH